MKCSEKLVTRAAQKCALLGLPVCCVSVAMLKEQQNITSKSSDFIHYGEPRTIHTSTNTYTHTHTEELTLLEGYHLQNEGCKHARGLQSQRPGAVPSWHLLGEHTQSAVIEYNACLCARLVWLDTRVCLCRQVRACLYV